MGRVGGLFVKEARGAPMRSVQSTELLARRGVRGNVHASALSPRQVLVQASSSAARGVFGEVRWPDQPRLPRSPHAP